MPKAPTARKTRASSDKKSPSTPEPFVPNDFDEEELAPAVQELRPMVEKDRNRSLQFYYILGRKVVEHYERVAEEREKYGWKMYGERFFERLAKAIDFSADLLHNSYKLATIYDEKAFQELCSHPQIQSSHALQLSYVPDADLRSELQAKVIDEEMTVRDIQREVREQYGQRRKAGAGRKPKAPKNVKAAFTHLKAQVEKFIKLNDENWFGKTFDILIQVQKLPADKLTDELMAQITDAAEQCENLAATATKDAEALRSVLPEIDRRKKAQAEAEAQIVAEAEEEEAAMAGAA